MSASGRSPSLRLTPKHQSYPALTSTNTPSKSVHDDNGLQLVLKTVIGTTTSSKSTFDSLADSHVFAYCAGPAVVLNRIDQQLNITQHLYRARPSASPLNATPSFYNPSTPPITPGRSRHGSPLKDRSYSKAPTVTSESTNDLPSHGRASNRSREVTCVSLSHCGRFLAVGETGHNPRVLIFSTSIYASLDTPLSILCDHSFGVSAVAFSVDSHWVCTLGNTFDAFILIYSIDTKNGSARLHSSNKCSNVNFVAWMGQSVISIGTRHVKVWRVETLASSPSKLRLDIDHTVSTLPRISAPKTLMGRNCLLGPLIDATFTAVVAISDQKAILCTSQGDICLLDDTQQAQNLVKIARVEFGILCIAFDKHNDRIIVSGYGGIFQPIILNELLEQTRFSSSLDISLSHFRNFSSSTDQNGAIVAIGIVRERMITIDSNRTIEIKLIDNSDERRSEPIAFKRLTAHRSAVLGICSLSSKSMGKNADFLTFSATGTVLFWRLNGECTGSIEIPLEQPHTAEEGDRNELKVVAHSDDGDFLVTGDKSGVVRLCFQSQNSVYGAQAHNGDINGIAISRKDDFALIVTGGRDRTLQIFEKDHTQIKLMQTLDDHAASISDVIFMNGPSTLLSISLDRTVIIRKSVPEDQAFAFVAIRVITLKSSPLSFTCVPSESHLVIIATMDRLISRYDIYSGQLMHKFKALDPTTNETVLMSSLGVHDIDDCAEQSRLLVGVSSTDKSIRIHNYYSGSMLTREHGQNAVSAIKLLPQRADGRHSQGCLVSCGLDGTILLWDIMNNAARPVSSDEAQISGEASPRSHPISRRILSRAKIIELKKLLATEEDTVSPIRNQALLPSRVPRNGSRYSSAAESKLSVSTFNGTKNGLVSKSSARSEREFSQDQLPASFSSPNTSRLKPRRPSLDLRRRSKSAANLNDMGDSAEKLCNSLQDFRRRFESSATDKLKAETVKRLQKELKFTTDSLAEQFNSGSSYERIDRGLLDGYLAKMIDERLAVRAESAETVKMRSKATIPEGEDEGETCAGAQEIDL